MIDRRDNETPLQYNERKEAEWLAAMQRFKDNPTEETLRASTQALSDSIDARILAEYTTTPFYGDSIHTLIKKHNG